MIQKKHTTKNTIEETIQYFKALKAAEGRSEKTIMNYEVDIHYLLKEEKISTDDTIDAINEEIILDWITKKRESGLSPNSINHYIRDLRVFINFCIEKEYISPFKIPTLKAQEPKLRVYTDEELELLTKTPSIKANYSEYRMWVIICFILATGARIGTIIDVKKEDIDFTNGTVTYRHLKNKHTAVIPLSAELVKVLKEYINTWNLSNSEYLFCSSFEEQLSYNSVRMALRKYCNKRGVKDLGLHAFRHAFARGWIKNGGGVFQLQRMLTHSSLTMTKRYVHLFDDDLKDNFEEFSPLDNLKSRRHHIKRV